MKTLRWVGRFITGVAVVVVGWWITANFDFLPLFYSAYPTEILAGIFALILLILGLCFLEIALHRRIKLKQAFDVSKPVKNLTHDDFHIAEYNKFYIKRESDKEIQNLLKERKYVFITGIPMLGKTRMAYEAVKKFKDFYLLKPKYEKIDIQKVRLPFFKKKIVLFLDDLDKYVGKFHPYDLIRRLKTKSKDFILIATCRSGQEFDQVFAEKEMEMLLTQCQKGKTEPRKLKQKEERELAVAVGKKLEEILSDGTPGSITIDLRYMKQRYNRLGDEKSILKCLKLLKQGNIFLWKEDLVIEISKTIFGLDTERTKWDSHIRSLQINGFIRITRESSKRISISHDIYLDDRFLDDYFVGDDDSVWLKDILFQSKDSINLFNLGYSFYLRDSLEKGVDCYQKSIRINPGNAKAHSNLGILLYELKRYDEAEKEYKEALQINPDLAEAHYNLGVLLARLKRYENAEKEYRKALRNNPDDADARNNLGNLLCKLKRYEEAEKEYKEALLINPDYAKAHNNLGNLLRGLKRYEEAEKEYKEVLRINPNDTDAHYNMGVLLYDIKRYEEAEKQYKEALRINPDDADAHANLGRLLYDLRRYEEAEKECKEVLRIDPQDAEAHKNLGLSLEKLRKYEEAEKEYREALRIKPDFAEAHLDLGASLIHMNRKEEARKELEIARDLSRKQGKEQSAKIAEEYLGEL